MRSFISAASFDRADKEVGNQTGLQYLFHSTPCLTAIPKEWSTFPNQKMNTISNDRCYFHTMNMLQS